MLFFCAFEEVFAATIAGWLVDNTVAMGGTAGDADFTTTTRGDEDAVAVVSLALALLAVVFSPPVVSFCSLLSFSAGVTTAVPAGRLGVV